MPLAIVIVATILSASSMLGRTIVVDAGGAYPTLEAASAAVTPGDTILFAHGVHAGGQYVANLQGTSDSWITIVAEPGGEAIIRGGSNGWQLVDAAYVRISGFIIEGQTGNGWNFDDGGTFDTPAHHIFIANCEWRGINATGNNDLLKLSGIDSFAVRDCWFSDGAAGGSMIDMVGCHDGTFEDNVFVRAGSNAIQAKGGTRRIRIERNRFIDAGLRGINVGGSTGLQFFRPQGAKYESAEIWIYSNLFVRSQAPIAFVGTVQSRVINNTFLYPQKWAIRILQETTDSGFVQCGDNVFSNNIVVLGNEAANPTVNIGSNTRPETFTFRNNLWYNADNQNWGGPILPSTETGGVVGSEPRLVAPPDDIRLGPGSPAIGAGIDVSDPITDFRGMPFLAPRSIGAVEGGASTVSVERDRSSGKRMDLSSHPTTPPRHGPITAEDTWHSPRR